MIMEKEKLEALVSAAQNGDSEALNELFNAFYNDFYYFAFKTVKDEDTALDVTQEAFVEIINTLGGLKEPAAFVTWAKQVVYHQCTRYFKKKKDVLVDEDEEGGSIFDNVKEENTDFIPDEALDKADFKKTVLEILDSLSEEQRSATMMYYFDEMSVKEIAEIQGVSEGTVKSRLNYARKAIKAAVEDYEKKNGVKLHALPFLPLFKWLFEGAFEGGLSASSASALAEGVTAASGATLSATVGGSAAATGIAAKLAAIPLVAKLISGAVAAAIVIGIGTVAIIGGGDGASGDGKPQADSSAGSSANQNGDSSHTHSWGEWTVTEEAFGVIKVESKTRSCAACSETEQISDLDDRWDFFDKHFSDENSTCLDRYFDVAGKADGPFDINGLFAAGDFLSAEPHYLETGESTATVSANEYYEKLGQHFALTDAVINEMKQVRSGDTYTVSFDYHGANLMVDSCVSRGGNRYTVYYTHGGSHATHIPTFVAEIEYNLHENRPNRIISLKTDGVINYDMTRVEKKGLSAEGYVKNVLSAADKLSDLRARRLIDLPEALADDYALLTAMDCFGYGITEEEMFGKGWGSVSIASENGGIKELTARFSLPQMFYSEDGKEHVFAAAKRDIEKFVGLVGKSSKLVCRIGKADAPTEVGIDSITDEAIRDVIGQWISENSICISTVDPILIDGRKVTLSYTIESPSGFFETEYSAALRFMFE